MHLLNQQDNEAMKSRHTFDTWTAQPSERSNLSSATRTTPAAQPQQPAALGRWKMLLADHRLILSDDLFRLFGIDSSDIPDSECLDHLETAMSFVHPDDRPRLQAAARTVLQNQTDLLNFEFRVTCPKGKVHLVHALGQIMTDAHGQRMLSGTLQDITAQRQSLEQLTLLEACIARLNDMVMITEATPLDEPGPRIVFVNDALEVRTGYSRQELIGKSPRLLQGPATDRAVLDRVRAALRGAQPVCVELINYTKDGTPFWVELDMVPVANNAGRVRHYVAVQRDITANRQNVQELAHTNRALQMLTRCNEAVIRTNDEQELLTKICQLAVDAGGYSMAWVGFAQHDAARSIMPMAHAGPTGSAEYIDSLALSWSATASRGNGPAGRTIRGGAPVIIEDFASEASLSPSAKTAAERGYRGLISLPLHDSRGQTFGVLALYANQVRAVSKDEVSLLQNLADNLAFGIGNIRSRNEARQLESVVMAVATSVSAGSGDAFFAQLARTMASAVNAQGGFVVRFLPGKPGMARTIGAVIDGAVIENFAYPIAGTPWDRLAEQDSCVVLNNLDLAFPHSRFLPDFGAQAYVGRRLDNAVGQPIGLLFVLFRQPLQQSNFVASAIHIFAARAAAELERQEADARIHAQASLLDKAQDAIIVCGIDHRITYWNKSAERLYGWSAEEALGRTKEEFLTDDPMIFVEAAKSLVEYGDWRGEVPQRRKNGSALTVEAHWTLVKDDDDRVQSILAIHTDITQRKKAEDKVQHLAFYDQLTGLPNRQFLFDRLLCALAASGRNALRGALMFIDLDNFKTLNDTLGHDMGDLLLQQVGLRLASCVRETDIVARLGGDEFVVLLEKLSEQAPEAALLAKSTGEKILAALNHPYQLAGYEHINTSSIGVTLFKGHEDSADDTLKRADLAMYQAKAAGRNTIRFFDPLMQAAVTHRLALEADLRQGARANEFRLYYQPQVDHDGRVTGAEALIRWQQPQRGLVSPADFIPLAEETGLILSLGRWVLETACQQLATWSTQDKTADLDIAVNVSARQFRHPDFVGLVLGVLADTGADPCRLKLELTESVLVDDIETTVSKMTALKDKGIGFSLDDFGTGYSSLSYLKRLPLDQLKIDQSFVRDVLTDPNDAAIARTIVALGQSLGLGVIAEGVETEAQRNFLADNGCHAYQGFLFGRPLRAEHFC